MTIFAPVKRRQRGRLPAGAARGVASGRGTGASARRSGRLPGGRRGGRVGSESLGRALKGTCALSGPARAIPGAATVVTPRGSRRCHSGAVPTTGSSHRDRFRKYYPKFSIDAARVTMRSFINPKT
eukprot:5952702-Prymnesium_polylepis.1